MGIFLAGAWLAISGKGVTAGVVIVFVQLMNYILNPISQVPLLMVKQKGCDCTDGEIVRCIIGERARRRKRKA